MNVAERRHLVAQLHREGKSLRTIARQIGASAPTIMRDLRAIDHAPAPPPQGNGRALKHGAYSVQRLAPLRERFMKEVRARFPGLRRSTCCDAL